MKFLVVCDIHGNIKTLNKLVDNFKEKIDGIICPGDFFFSEKSCHYSVIVDKKTIAYSIDNNYKRFCKLTVFLSFFFYFIAYHLVSMKRSDWMHYVPYGSRIIRVSRKK